MSADMPKPVAYWNEEYASIFTTSYVAEHRRHIELRIKSGELKPIFTESQLREYAEAKCAELRAAADWNESCRRSIDELLKQAVFLPDSSVRHQLALMNFDKSALEPRQ